MFQSEMITEQSLEDLHASIDVMIALWGALGITDWTLTEINTYTPGCFCVIAVYK